MTQATLPETLAVAIAATLRARDVGFTGLTTGDQAALFGTMIPMAAMQLARLTHAPRLTALLAGWSYNPSLGDLDAVPGAEFDPKLLALASDGLDMGFPNMYSSKRGDVTVGFCSGAQVDRWGNVNTVRIGTATDTKVRLVGPILVPEHLALYGREIIMLPRHDRRTLVEHVDHVTGVGYPGGRDGRRKLGLPGGGPDQIVTPLCVFDFDGGGSARVRSINPGTSVEQLRESTGFALGDLDDPPVTPEPAPELLELLRSRVDPHGILRR